jgi:hypothetical protein
MKIEKITRLNLCRFSRFLLDLRLRPSWTHTTNLAGLRRNDWPAARAEPCHHQVSARRL